MTSWEEKILGKMSILQKPIVQNVMRGKLSSCNCKFEALMNLVSLEEVKERQDVVRRDGRESNWSELEVGIDDSHWQRANETEGERERGLASEEEGTRQARVGCMFQMLDRLGSSWL